MTRKKAESVELPLVFETNKSALYFILVDENYLQTTAPNRTAHTSLAEIIIDFWPPQASREDLLAHAD